MTLALPGIDRILLVGFMGSGKSTVGRILAARLAWKFLDFDEAVEARIGRTIREVFEAEGEAFFRVEESAVGRELLSKKRVVLATGGGWPVDSANWDAVPPRTVSVWLDVAPGTVMERLAEGGSIRPLLAKNDRFRQARTLIGERRAAYERADCRVVTDPLTPKQVASEIEALVKNRSVTDQSSERMSN